MVKYDTRQHCAQGALDRKKASSGNLVSQELMTLAVQNLLDTYTHSYAFMNDWKSLTDQTGEYLALDFDVSAGYVPWRLEFSLKFVVARSLSFAPVKDSLRR